MLNNSTMEVKAAERLTLICYKLVVCESRLAALRDSNASPVSVALIKEEAEMSLFKPALVEGHHD